jgi:hypothetical protein
VSCVSSVTTRIPVRVRVCVCVCVCLSLLVVGAVPWYLSVRPQGQFAQSTSFRFLFVVDGDGMPRLA